VIASLRSLRERVAASLFLVPMAFVLLGVVLAVGLLALDEALDDVDLPLTVASTVDASRSVLSTVASATMAFAGIAFSVALLVVQMSASQYSPRVVQGLFRDRFNKMVMGAVVGTFTYCLVVLRSVHGDIDGGPESVVPTISVTVAVLLGVATVLAIVAFIDHNAHRMDVSEILQEVTQATKKKVEETWPEAGSGVSMSARWDETPAGPGTVVSAPRDGWLQTVELDIILGLLPVAGTARVESVPGRYVVEGTALVTVWPEGSLDHEAEEDMCRSFVIGDARTLTQDPAYGVRQLVDVALRALSPGVNDPTTAQDAIFHLAAVLHSMLAHDPPAHQHLGDGGRRALVPQLPSHEGLLDLALGELRLAAAPHPVVCTYLLEAIHLAGDGRRPDRDRDAVVLGLLDDQAVLVRKAFLRTDPTPWDRQRVEAAFEERFPLLDEAAPSRAVSGRASDG
jgi:uncharacterized membrane protein